MFTTELRVGRLYEHRLGTLSSEDELTALAVRGKEVMQSSVNKVVVCADYRRVKFMKAELVATFVAFLSNVNTHIERSAIWIDPKNGIFNVQVARIVREANFPTRKVFREGRRPARLSGRGAHGCRARPPRGLYERCGAGIVLIPTQEGRKTA